MSICINNLTYTYSEGTTYEATAVHDITATVSQGDFVGIMGHTGSGKSTLIQIISGLRKPTAGTVTIDGTDIYSSAFDQNLRHALVGIVFQYPEYQLFENTVYKDVAFGLKHLPLSKEEKEARIQWALTVCGFDYEQIKNQSPLALSGGEKRRVAIANVLATKPKYLILDEPFAGLDSYGRQRFIALFQELNQQGMTIILVTHNADCVAECANHLMIFSEGRLVNYDKVETIFSHVEELQKLHLNVSESCYIAHLLRKKNIHVPENIIKYEDLKNFLADNLGGGH